MDIKITEQNGGYTAVFEGRLDTPAAVKAQQDIARTLRHFWNMLIRLSHLIAQNSSTSVVRVFACF